MYTRAEANLKGERTQIWTRVNCDWLCTDDCFHLPVSWECPCRGWHQATFSIWCWWPPQQFRVPIHISSCLTAGMKPVSGSVRSDSIYCQCDIEPLTRIVASHERFIQPQTIILKLFEHSCSWQRALTTEDLQDRLSATRLLLQKAIHYLYLPLITPYP